MREIRCDVDFKPMQKLQDWTKRILGEKSFGGSCSSVPSVKSKGQGCGVSQFPILLVTIFGMALRSIRSSPVSRHCLILIGHGLGILVANKYAEAMSNACQQVVGRLLETLKDLRPT